jgi:hypothetical protein
MAATTQPPESTTQQVVQQRRPSENSAATEGTPETILLEGRGIGADQRAVLARSMQVLIQAGFGYNSTPASGVISMQRAWQGPREDLVMVDVITLDTHGQGLAVREGPTGRPVWGPDRGAWPAVVTAILSQTCPNGYAQVAPRARSLPQLI